MAKQYHAFIQFDKILVAYEQQERVRKNPIPGPEPKSISPLNGDRLFMNNELINVIKRFMDSIEFTIFFRFTKKSIVEKCLENCGLRTGNRFHIVPAGSLIQNGIKPQIANNNDTHELIIICEDNLLSEISSKTDYESIIRPNTSLIHILPCFFWYPFYVFKEHLKQNINDTSKVAYLFADNSHQVNNFLAYMLNAPDYAQFLYRRQFKIQSDKKKELFHTDFLGPFFLFDYHVIKFSQNSDDGNNKSFHDQHTNFMIKKLKDDNNANELTAFFANVLIHFYLASIDINSCAFFVYPSSQEGCWNEPLLSALKSELASSGYKYNTLEGLYRKTSVQKQHLSGERNINLQQSSIVLRIQNISQFEYAIVIDDLTTTGTSFSAAERVLRENGFQGIVRSFAVAGTKTSFNKTLSTSNNYTHTRPLSTNAYIFDLDNTLIGSDIAKQYREGDTRNWSSAIKCIPEMKQFYCVVDAVKRLIKKGIDVAIVTSSNAEYCYRILQYLGISADEIVCVTYHDTVNHKPCPDPYLFAEKQFRHDNKNIFCIGDQQNDILACENANQKDPYHNYVPLLALWHKDWNLDQNILQLHTIGKQTVLEFEVQLLDFLGFIIPAKQNLYNLIHNYIRPTFVDLNWTDDQFYNMLQEKEYVDNRMRITEYGRSSGLSYSEIANGNIPSNIECDYRFQINLINQLIYFLNLH